MKSILIGWLVLGLPLLFLGMYFLWRRWRTIFWMYCGALLVGFGYLTTTGAMRSVGTPVQTLIYGSEDAAGEADPAPAVQPDATPGTAGSESDASGEAQSEPAAP